MREHLYRVRWRDTGKPIEDFMSEYIWDALNSEYFIVEQYTGLKDSNGVRIFEGDIIDSFYSNGEWEQEPISVIWGGGGDSDGWSQQGWSGWSLANKKGHHGSLSDSVGGDDWTGKHKCQVIGNKWENPELLEQTNDS